MKLFVSWGLDIPSPFDTDIKENSMGRHTNELLRVLLDDPSKKDAFIQLVNNLGAAHHVREYLRSNEVFGKRYHFSTPTVRGIIRRLGFSGRRGRTPQSQIDRYKQA